MDTVPVSEFKAKCLALLEQVKKTGKPLSITRRGELIAQVIPPPPPSKPASWLGCLESTVEIKGDMVGPAVSENDGRYYSNRETFTRYPHL